MIAETSSGRSFGELGRYLIHGRSGEETNRAAWSAGRNLGTDDPDLAAPLMRATALQNVRVQYPVYHLTIAFDPSDPVTREKMERVADRVLNDLGLSTHQALIVAHQDRAHQHVHVMVNRVHPDTGLAWERWQDRRVIERALREEEQALGFKVVPGRLHQLDSRDIPARGLLTRGERHRSDRLGELAFAERVKEHVAEFRGARSWSELEERLAKSNFRLEPKGQGLVITDGEHQVKASRIGRDLSLHRLEARFGVQYDEYLESRRRFVDHSAANEQARRTERPSPAVSEVARTVREYERLIALQQERSAIGTEAQAARDRLRELDEGVKRIADHSATLAEHFRSIFRDPTAAQTRFADAVQKDSANRGVEAVRTLRDRPEMYGQLQTVERRRVAGLLIETDEGPARERASQAAKPAQQFAETASRLNDTIQKHVGAAANRFDRALALVYQQPEPARQAFDHLLRTAGPERAIQALRERPDHFGALVRTDATAAGRESPSANIAACHLVERASEMIEARDVVTSALARTQITQHAERSTDRERQITKEIEHMPGRHLLENTIARGLRQLEPNELTQLRRVLTNPQRALAFKIGEQVRDAALGRDDLEM